MLKIKEPRHCNRKTNWALKNPKGKKLAKIHYFPSSYRKKKIKSFTEKVKKSQKVTQTEKSTTHKTAQLGRQSTKYLRKFFKNISHFEKHLSNASLLSTKISYKIIKNKI